MSDDQHVQQHRLFPRFLFVSLLFHGLCMAAAGWWLPHLVTQKTEPAAIIMVNLAGSPLPQGSPPPAAYTAVAPPKAYKIASPKPVEPPPESTVTAAPVTLPTSTQRTETAHSVAAAPAAVSQHADGTSGQQQVKGGATPGVPITTGGHSGASERVTPYEIPFGTADGPKFHQQIRPAYPSLARRRGKTGTVLLRLSISETGQLTKVEVLEDPGSGFSEAAVEAVRASSFTPARHNGRPVAVKAILPVRFTLH